jgi:hypothetical protein
MPGTAADVCRAGAHRLAAAARKVRLLDCALVLLGVVAIVVAPFLMFPAG